MIRVLDRDDWPTTTLSDRPLVGVAVAEGNVRGRCRVGWIRNRLGKKSPRHGGTFTDEVLANGSIGQKVRQHIVAPPSHPGRKHATVIQRVEECPETRFGIGWHTIGRQTRIKIDECVGLTTRPAQSLLQSRQARASSAETDDDPWSIATRRIVCDFFEPSHKVGRAGIDRWTRSSDGNGGAMLTERVSQAIHRGRPKQRTRHKQDRRRDQPATTGMRILWAGSAMKSTISPPRWCGAAEVIITVT